MYGFIHCCLEDMVVQLFGEPAWREILNISGIKLRGASFLMHQVYDDEMTFKLVSAASTVSGLSVDQCLEQFGRHFLVYCQKNGYDQILRVLGSNLYDFLTNLDNLHDHLASIYPGMRAPSFRVTRHINTNHGPAIGGAAGAVGLPAKQFSFFSEEEPAPEVGAAAANQQQQQQQQVVVQVGVAGDELHKQNASCSTLTGSMYLHYYSERPSLSPIVKGLVMAVAHEFFQVDILVSECRLAASPLVADDHVVFRIDRAHSKVAAPETVSGSKPDTVKPAPAPTTPPPPPPDASGEQILTGRRKSAAQDEPSVAAAAAECKLNVYDCLSTNARDSLVSSEIMMRTFPFHVIFDRQFNLVQVGQSLLRCTSRLWRQRQAARPQRLVRFGDLFRIVRPKIEFTFAAIADHTNQVFVVKTLEGVLNVESQAGGPPVVGAATGVRRSSRRSSRADMATCPFSRLAAQRRAASGAPPDQSHPPEVRPAPTDAASNTNKPREGHAPKEEEEEEDGELQPRAELRLKGQMIILLGGQLCLYLCSPRVDNLGQLAESGISMADFALHDRVRELMLMSHTHKEDREAVKKLDQATNDLRKMETKLRQENERTNEVLHNIFPAKIAKILSQGVKVESETFEMVSCLYSDIIGFTKMCGSENVRPIDIVRLLNTMYLQFDNLTNIHGVYKVETIGDAYVVVGGLPEPAPDHADRCVKMGLDMVKVIGSVRSPADNQPIQMRIGIHSGPVMAGIVGVRVPRYSLFGNTTTRANQLETHGVAGKIHISDFTLRNLINRERFVVEDNRSEINGIPFATHFVTEYLREPAEARHHDRLLKEQLIRDLELLGNAELELVDESLEQPVAAPLPVPRKPPPHPAPPPPGETPGSSRVRAPAEAAWAAAEAGQLTKDLEAPEAAAADAADAANADAAPDAGQQLLAYAHHLAGSLLARSMEQVGARRAGYLVARELLQAASPAPVPPPTPVGCARCAAAAGSSDRKLAPLSERERLLVRAWLLNGAGAGASQVSAAWGPAGPPAADCLELLLANLTAPPRHHNRPLASEAQRIRRMDTLKSRRLRRRKQAPGPPHPSCSSGAASQPALLGAIGVIVEAPMEQQQPEEDEEEEAGEAEEAEAEEPSPKSGAAPEARAKLARAHWAARLHCAAASPLASLARQLAGPKRSPATSGGTASNSSVRGCFCLGSSASSHSLQAAGP